MSQYVPVHPQSSKKWEHAGTLASQQLLRFAFATICRAEIVPIVSI